MKRFPRRLAIALYGIVVLLLIGAAALHLNGSDFSRVLAKANPLWLVVGAILMITTMAVRAVSWRLVLRDALPTETIRLGAAFRALSIGVFLSATSPLRLGEAARATVMTLHTSDRRRAAPTVVGSIGAQTVMNVAALIILGVAAATTTSLLKAYSLHLDTLLIPVAVIVAVIAIYVLFIRARFPRAHSWAGRFTAGLAIFRHPRAAALATAVQLGAWAIQTAACYSILLALHIHTSANLAAAMAVLFAVNATAVLPLTPANIGVFQAACVAVLSGLFGISYSAALAYGVGLQVVELITAAAAGSWALAKEGFSYAQLANQARDSES